MPIIPVLDLHYRLVNGADFNMVPDPVVANGLGLVYLKTSRTINLKYNSILKVPTGIEIVRYPTFNLNSVPDIKVSVVGRCYSIPELEEEEGVSVLGPKFLTSDRYGEIIVTIKNFSQNIFRAERGEPIALFAFELLPQVQFTLADS